MSLPPLRRAFPTGAAVPAAPPPLRRWRTLAGGAALGGVLLVGTAFLGSAGERTRLTPLGPSESPPADHQAQASPQRVVQPEAENSATADPVTTPAPPPPATTESVPAREVAVCTSLFEEPARLAQHAELPPVEVADVRAGSPQDARDEPARTVFRASRPDETHTRLHAFVDECGAFPAALPDGTSVTVQVAQEGPAYRLAVSGEDGPDLAGWLTVVRAGQVVSVWRMLYPVTGERDGDPQAERRDQWREWWREWADDQRDRDGDHGDHDDGERGHRDGYDGYHEDRDHDDGDHDDGDGDDDGYHGDRGEWDHHERNRDDRQ